MSEVTAKITLDTKTLKKAQSLFSDLGMDLSSAINIFLRQSIRENAIPFEITKDIPNKETKKAIDHVRNGIGLSKGFHSVSELMEDLYADD